MGEKDSRLQQAIGRCPSRNSTGQETVEWHIQSIERLNITSQEYSIHQLSFRSKGEINVFSDKRRLKKFTSTWVALPEGWKELFRLK